MSNPESPLSSIFDPFKDLRRPQPPAAPRSDSDGDGLTLIEEQRLGTDPNKFDTDGDGWSDRLEVSAGRDAGFDERDETDLFRWVDDQRAANQSDVDGDGLTRLEERRHGTNPFLADTDHDGFDDYHEVANSSNPLHARSVPRYASEIGTGQDMVESALESVGDRYRLGAEAAEYDLNPSAFDSSELVEWAAAQTGVDLPDGSWRQYQALHKAGGDTSIAEALATPGALLFHFDGDPLASSTRPAGASVVISLGDGRVIHASSAAGEVVVADADDYDFTHAAVITEFADDDVVAATSTASIDGDDQIELLPFDDEPAFADAASVDQTYEQTYDQSGDQSDDQTYGQTYDEGLV